MSLPRGGCRIWHGGGPGGRIRISHKLNNKYRNSQYRNMPEAYGSGMPSGERRSACRALLKLMMILYARFSTRVFSRYFVYHHHF